MRPLSVLDRAKYPVTLSDGRVIYSRHDYRRLLEQQLNDAGLLHGVDARGLAYQAELDAPRTSTGEIAAVTRQ
jgi:hypothetical protein